MNSKRIFDLALHTLPDKYSCARFRASRFKAENKVYLINSITINDGLLAMPEKIETGYVEQLGQAEWGYKETYRTNALPEPEFEEMGNFFKVTIFRTRLTLSPDLEDAYELIRQGAPLGSKEIAGIIVYPSEYSPEETQTAWRKRVDL